MNEIVLATHNKNKVAEIARFFDRHGVKVLGLDAFPEIKDIEETGETFEENAILKATTVAHVTGMPSLADDSGLEVDALNGLPGVRSARFSGETATDEENNAKLLSLLSGLPEAERSARFVSVIACAMPAPKGVLWTVRGTCEGLIVEEPRGHGGFGYDPLFFIGEAGCTMAELDLEAKNVHSHRGKALREALKRLKPE